MNTSETYCISLVSMKQSPQGFLQPFSTITLTQQMLEPYFPPLEYSTQNEQVTHSKVTKITVCRMEFLSSTHRAISPSKVYNRVYTLGPATTTWFLWPWKEKCQSNTVIQHSKQSPKIRNGADMLCWESQKNTEKVFSSLSGDPHLTEAAPL